MFFEEQTEYRDLYLKKIGVFESTIVINQFVMMKFRPAGIMGFGG
jgi:hypothetical protein